jgi:WD40 repeat protein
MYDLRKTSEAVQSYTGHKVEISAIAMHPFHENMFASGDTNGSLYHWTTTSEEPIAQRLFGELGSHEGCIWSLQYHPLGHILASGSNDHSCKFWCRNRPGEGIAEMGGTLVENSSVELGMSYHRTPGKQGDGDHVPFSPPGMSSFLCWCVLYVCVG